MLFINKNNNQVQRNQRKRNQPKIKSNLKNQSQFS